MMHLIGELITEFRLSIQDSHEILASKNQNMRDVVTELDLKLHRIGKDFTQGSGYSFVSEESFDESQPLDLVGEKLFIFDPVDGSNNLLLGIDSICSVGAFVNHGQIESSFLVAFGEAQYRTWDGSSHVTSRRVGICLSPQAPPTTSHTLLPR